VEKRRSDKSSKKIKLGNIILINERAIRGLTEIDGNGVFEDMFLRSKESLIIKEEFVTDDPSEVIILAFGKKANMDISNNFEKLWESIHSPDFIHRDKLYEIISKYELLLKSSKLPVPNIKSSQKRQLNDLC
jgi:hypothetical protein